MKFVKIASADRVSAVVFFLLGLAMFWGGIEMDRLEFRRIHPASIPGLVPIFLGAILMLCSILLGRTKPVEPEILTGAAPDAASSPSDKGNWRDFSFVAIWSSIFAIFMVGNLPFAVASTIYIAVFAAWFLWPQQSTFKKRIWMVGLVALFALLSAVGISTLFQYGFLVRLP